MHSQQLLMRLYRTLYTIRVFETECVTLYRQGLIVGSMHIADVTKGNIGANGIVGAGIPIGAGAGPVLIEAKTYRHGGHHVNDPGLYMPKERLERYKARDPIGIGRKYLLEQASVPQESDIIEAVRRCMYVQ